MRDEAPIQLVERYFGAVDRKDLVATLDCFTPDATFTIATFDTVHRGRDEGIRTMFERLNTRYAKVWHGDFDHVVQPPLRIASRFRVENTLSDGSVRVKHNCNFFCLDVSGGQPRFDQVVVYMSGDNSLA
jgi:ketosteroid isomerase-like protein